MPDFTVIDGGGRPRSRGDNNARYHLRRLIVEILRGLARGEDAQQRIIKALEAFLADANQSDTPIEQIISDFLADRHDDLTPCERMWPMVTGSNVSRVWRVMLTTSSEAETHVKILTPTHLRRNRWTLKSSGKTT